ncbi:hypothetical protein MXB_635 [Myxobolus squamalis]|nr:hypothetical protein MXB_635 [Myxobolus squamalis]
MGIKFESNPFFWIHPDLLSILKQRSISIDCTFKCIPKLLKHYLTSCATMMKFKKKIAIRGLICMICIYYSSQLKGNLSQQQ